MRDFCWKYVVLPVAPIWCDGGIEEFAFEVVRSGGGWGVTVLLPVRCFGFVVFYVA